MQDQTGEKGGSEPLLDLPLAVSRLLLPLGREKAPIGGHLLGQHRPGHLRRSSDPAKRQVEAERVHFRQAKEQQGVQRRACQEYQFENSPNRQIS